MKTYDELNNQMYAIKIFLKNGLAGYQVECEDSRVNIDYRSDSGDETISQNELKQIKELYLKLKKLGPDLKYDLDRFEENFCMSITISETEQGKTEACF